jgi:hypothetical protein
MYISTYCLLNIIFPLVQLTPSQVGGRLFPIVHHYLPPASGEIYTEDTYLPELIDATVTICYDSWRSLASGADQIAAGDVLVFCVTPDACDLAAERFAVWFFFCYSIVYR